MAQLEAPRHHTIPPSEQLLRELPSQEFSIFSQRKADVVGGNGESLAPITVDPAKPDRLRVKEVLAQARSNEILIDPTIEFLQPVYPEDEFREKAIFITGVSHFEGFGYEVAKQLVEMGARAVAFNYRASTLEVLDIIDDLSARAEKSGSQIIPVLADISHVEEAKGLVQRVVNRTGQLDVFIDNAGIIAMGKLAESTPEDVVKAHMTNIVGPQIIQDAAVKHMIHQGTGGRVVNIESMGMLGTPEQRLYVAAKMAKVGAGRSGAIEHVRDKISFVGVAPAFAETAMTRVVPENQRPGLKKLIGQEDLTARDVAEYILFASSSLAEGYNGQTIPVVRPFRPRPTE